jgi:uncharacterized protein (DUF58 family)
VVAAAAIETSTPADLARQSRRILIRTRRLADGMLAGQYLSIFKGSGIEFAEVREYVPGDDVRAIDWNVTARLGFPYVKRHVEERELTVMLLVDVSGSARFGSARRLKAETAVQLSALLAASAVRNNDRVGLILFTDRIERFIPPQKERNRTLRVIHELLSFTPTGRGTDVAAALDHLRSVVRRRSVTFVLSDLQAPDYERALRAAHRRHDVVLVSIADRRERSLPPVGLIAMRDPETGRSTVIDSGSAAVRRQFEERWERASAARRRLATSLGVDMIEVDAAEDPVRPLLRFFRRREKRLREGR